MRSIEDKEISGGSNAISFEFHKQNGVAKQSKHSTSSSTSTTNAAAASHHRTGLGKLPTPSKWDDAQKWLVGLSRGVDKNQSKTKPRNSNADDLRLIAPLPQKEQEYYSSGEDEGKANGACADLETKNVDCGDDSVWRSNNNKPMMMMENPSSAGAMRSICLRDMGTEMTPIASLEPSRAGTPMRATSPAARSPISSRSTTPVRACQHGMQVNQQGFQGSSENGRSSSTSTTTATNESIPCGRGNGGSNKRYVEESNVCKNSIPENLNSDQPTKPNPLETRVMAWDEAERAKYLARYKREEVKIQAWENHEKRKAEMEMRKMEVKAERMKARAQEKLTNKLAATRRIAEEKRANAEAKLNEKALKTSEKADYIRRTGHLPSSFTCNCRLPSSCW